jgi:hypothetical protein
MKTKILMAFLAVFFLATGSALAIPVVDFTVEGNDIIFNVTNDLTGYGIYGVGFAPADSSITGSWDGTLPSGLTYNPAATNGYVMFFVDPYVYGVDTIEGIRISYTELPEIINTLVYVLGATPYEGEGNDMQFIAYKNNQYFYKVHGEANTAVPEPATILLLGLGIVGVTALRKKTQK